MVKVNTSSTMSPFRMIAGSDVMEDDYLAVVREQGHAAGYNPEVFGSGGAGPNGWGGYGAIFDAAALNTWRLAGEGTFRVGDDHKEVQVGALCSFSAANTGDVRIVVDGVERALISFTNATNATWVSALFSVATIGGAGEYDYQIQFRQTAGAAADNELVEWTLQAAAVDDANDWPDPSG
jgi:hypothetical protein